MFIIYKDPRRKFHLCLCLQYNKIIYVNTESMVNNLQFYQKLESFVKKLEELKRIIEDYSKKTILFKKFNDLKIN